MQPDQRISKFVRISAIVLGVAVLIWIPIEDTNILWVVLFSGLACLLAAWLAAAALPATARQRWFALPLLGALAGLLVTPLAVLLMAFKTGIHGHGSPDFTPMQVSAVLQRFPIWIAIGFLAGCMAVLWQKVR